MMRKLLDDTALRRWVDGLIARNTVYGVQARGDAFAFEQLTDASELRLDYDVTLLPPKKYFHPQREILFRFDRATMTFESAFDSAPFVLLGVHPYDMAAISQLDTVFSKDHCDRHYLARRQAATIVVSDVQNASADVFASCMGHATMEGKNGHDLLLTLLDDGRYLADAASDKGLALLAPLAEAPDADAGALAARAAVWSRNRERLRRHELEVAPSDLPGLLARSYDHPVWEEKAELCYSCGSCNLVCPTCYCFDVRDELDWDPRTGRRERVWDGCMLKAFAAVAGGHNFRGDRAARYRHRYFRKGKYTWHAYGAISCVGCGRCIAACTSNIANPVEIYNRLLEDS